MRNTSPIMLGVALMMAFLPVHLSRAQMLSPDDAKQKARFDAVQHAVAKAGYTNPVVVGVSDEPAGALFALLATHKGQGVLLVAVEPTKNEAVHLVDVETDKTSADIGVRGVSFTTSFIDEKDLVDVIVSHTPFRLEQSHSFDLHHVLRRSDAALTLACDFNGSSSSSVSKGMRSMSSKTTVTVQKVDGAKATSFDVKTVTENSESDNNNSSPRTQRTESTTRYQVIESGSFVPVKQQGE